MSTSCNMRKEKKESILVIQVFFFLIKLVFSTSKNQNKIDFIPLKVFSSF